MDKFNYHKKRFYKLYNMDEGLIDSENRMSHIKAQRKELHLMQQAWGVKIKRYYGYLAIGFVVSLALLTLGFFAR
ncbi:hypothetical protein [Burkholderia multivorans]|uniref:hypothetical protein n=1 Tax=Burkholderia multivorans TaxID=87883 RepID=UPI001C221E23|nr:hypothetical protein [Burkholderia multivorans]MBU9553878.1 hypothetical protein [Burkholderia multivorans]